MSEQLKNQKMSARKDVYDVKQLLNNSVQGIKRDIQSIIKAEDEGRAVAQSALDEKVAELEEKFQMSHAELSSETKQMTKLFATKVEFVDSMDEMKEHNNLFEKTQKQKFEDYYAKFQDVYDTIDRKVDQVERRCKIDAQRVAELTMKRSRKSAGVRGGGGRPTSGNLDQISSHSGVTSSHANFPQQKSFKVLLLSQSGASG